MNRNKHLQIAQWGYSRDQAPPRRATPLFESIRNSLLLNGRGEHYALPSVHDGCCGNCGMHMCRCPDETMLENREPPRAATGERCAPSGPGEREGWSLHAVCPDKWNLCRHFAGAPATHVWDGGGSFHVTIGDSPSRFSGSLIDAQLHVESLAAQPSAPAAFASKRAEAESLGFRFGRVGDDWAVYGIGVPHVLRGVAWLSAEGAAEELLECLAKGCQP